jgi:hypothetical protein
VDPDVFITIAFVSLSVVLGLGLITFFVSEARREGTRSAS